MHMQIMVSLVNRNKACGDDASGEEACDDGKVRRPMLIGHQGPLHMRRGLQMLGQGSIEVQLQPREPVKPEQLPERQPKR